MKTASLLRVALFGTLASGTTWPAMAAPTAPRSFSGTPLPFAKIPSEVRAQMAPGAKTLSLKQFPIGANGTPILLHAWTLSRRSPDSAIPAIYCVDLFYHDTPNAKKWQLGYTTSYVGASSPLPNSISYTVRWLHPATKKGVVIIEKTTQITGATLRLLTLPEGAPTESPSERDPHYVQEFFESYNGGIATISFTTDANGNMTIERSTPAYIVPKGTPPNYTWLIDTYVWRESRWLKIASKRAANSSK